MWPSGTTQTDVTMLGGSFLATNDHSLSHRQLGSVVNQLPTVFGTTPGTNLFGAYTPGQLPLAENGGTIQKAFLGTFTYQAGTITGQIQNNGTIANGTYGTAFLQGGTISQAIFQLGTAGTLVLNNPFFQNTGTNNGNIIGGTYTNPGIIINERARAYLGTTMGTVANNTEFKILLDTKDYDTGTNFDVATNHRYTAPIAGYYLITAQSSPPDGQGSSGGRWATEIRKNGTNIQFGISHLSNVNGLTTSTSGIFNLAVNDYIELWAYNLTGTNTGAVGGSIYNSLSIHLLSV